MNLHLQMQKITGKPTDNQHLVNKKYVNDKLADVSSNVHFISVKSRKQLIKLKITIIMMVPKLQNQLQ